MRDRNRLRGAIADFVVAVAIVLCACAAYLFLDAVRSFESVAPSQLRTLALVYQAGWVFSTCFPVAFFAGVAFAVSRLTLNRDNLSRLIISTCALGALASIGLYLHNDLVLPEFNHRVAIYLVEAGKPGAEHKVASDISLESRPRGLREMSVSMLHAEHKSVSSKAPDGTWKRRLRDIKVELQKRYSLSFSAFAFAVAGLAMGLSFRMWRGWPVLVISIIFFPAFLLALAIVGVVCGRGHLSPMAMWVPEIVILGIGSAALVLRVQRGDW